MRKRAVFPTVGLLVLAQCSSDDEPSPEDPRPQLVVIIDTDMPTSSDIAENPTLFAPASAIDTVRVDVTGDTPTPTTRVFAVPDRQAWPVSFGIAKGGQAASSVFIRVRLFRASLALTVSAAAESAPPPDPNVTVDRLVRLDLPATGVHFARVRLHGDCIGTPASILTEQSCIEQSAAGTDPTTTTRIGNAREAIELDPPESDRASTLLASWPLARIAGCKDPPGVDRKCIRGGLTILGDRESAGFFGSGKPFPFKPVVVSPFYIDTTEVTVGQYRFIEPKIDEKYRALRNDPTAPFREYCTVGTVKDRQPVNCIEWEGARQACVARGGTLPTEAEWELAARGLEMRKFPWGNVQPKCCTASIARESYTASISAASCKALGKGPEEVGSHATTSIDCPFVDKTPEGVLDLGASMVELTLDSFLPYSHTCWGVGLVKNPKCDQPQETKSRSGRGAGWSQGALLALSAPRHAAGAINQETGFRCRYDAKPADDAP